MKFSLAAFLKALLSAILAGLAGGTVAVSVGFLGCNQPVPPQTQPDSPPPPTKPEPPKPDALNAIGRIAMANGYCSGTVIAPRLADGRWHIITAAHCVKNVGERVTFLPRTGGSVPCTVQAINRQADACILSTDVSGDLAFTELATEDPQPGTAIWHAGFGIHVPGNVEKGKVLSSANRDGQIRYHLSVSPGDSGGGIVTDAAGKLLSPVCCTTCLGCPGDVYGASPSVVRKMLSTPTDFVDLKPIAMPAAPVPE